MGAKRDNIACTHRDDQIARQHLARKIRNDIDTARNVCRLRMTLMIEHDVEECLSRNTWNRHLTCRIHIHERHVIRLVEGTGELIMQHFCEQGRTRIAVRLEQDMYSLPTIVMSGAEILCRGVLPFLLSSRFGYYGIWWATPIGWSLSLLIGIIRYRSGKWKNKVRTASV